MATLHFDIDAGYQTADQIKAFRENVHEQLRTLSARINNQFVGIEWQGQAAEAFRTEYNDWANYQLLPQLNALENLEMALRTQIDNWSQTSSSFTP